MPRGRILASLTSLSRRSRFVQQRISSAKTVRPKTHTDLRAENTLGALQPSTDDLLIYLKTVPIKDRKEFFKRMHELEIECLSRAELDEVHKVFDSLDMNADGTLDKNEFARWYLNKDGQIQSCSGSEEEPTRIQHWQYFLRIGVPFFAFGFLDNSLMLIFGDMIDHHIATKIGLSTMFSAGAGNVFADILGVGFGDAVERALASFGLKDPKLSTQQLALPTVRRTRTMASLIGMGSGCSAGMIPLLFL